MNHESGRLAGQSAPGLYGCLKPRAAAAVALAQLGEPDRMRYDC